MPFSRPETKGSKMSAAISGGMPGPSSMISIVQGQRGRGAVLAAHAQRQVVEGVQADRAAAGPRARFGGVLDQVQEHLHQLVRVGTGRRQRGVVILDDRHMGGKAHQGRSAGAVQRIVDVHRAAVRRAQVAELLDLLQQFHDAAGFLDDQIGQFRSSGARFIDSSCAAPEMPASGFLISCASISAMPMADFAADFARHRPAHPVGDLARRQDQQDDVGVVVQRREMDRALHRRRGRRWSHRHR